MSNNKNSRQCKRNTKLGVGLLLILGLTGLSSQSFALGCSSWTEVSTDRFTLITSFSPERALPIAESLNRFEAAIEIVTSARDFKPTVPTKVFVLDLYSWGNFIGPNVAGYFYSTPFENRLLVLEPSRQAANPYTTAMHEYVHYVLRNQGSIVYPRWYNEGLAEVLSASIEDDKIFQLGLLWRERVRDAVGSTNWIPFQQLMTVFGDIPSHRDPNYSAIFYGESTLLVHYLLFSEMRKGELAAYLKAINRGTPHEQAFLDAFDSTYRELEDEVRKYAKEKLFSGFRLPKTALVARTPATARAIPCVKGRLELGYALLEAGADPLDVSGGWFDRDESDGNRVNWRLAKATAAVASKDYRRANSYVEEVLAMPDLSGDVYIKIANLWFSQVHRPKEADANISDADHALLERARKILSDKKVRERDTPQMAYAVASVDLALREDIGDATEVALHALEQWPKNPYLAQVTARLCELNNDPGNAAGAWSIAAAYAQTLETRKVANEAIKRIDDAHRAAVAPK